MIKVNRRKEFFDIICPYFEGQGFKFYNHQAVPSFVKTINNNLAYHFFIHFKTKGGPDFSRFMITHFEIENVIFDLSIPNFDIELYNKNSHRAISATMEQLYKKIKFDESKYMETVENYKSYAKAILKYAETDGKEFIEKYSFLPNILLKMNELENKGENWINEGLGWKNQNGDSIGGNFESNFKVLIISKLCNDPQFEEKVKKVDIMFKTWANEEWNLCYEQLKLKLTKLSPKYNL